VRHQDLHDAALQCKLRALGGAAGAARKGLAPLLEPARRARAKDGLVVLASRERVRRVGELRLRIEDGGGQLTAR
jgi:hypothetical protein